MLPFQNRNTLRNLRGFFRRHWQQLLLIREKIRFSEEAFHLVLAGGVGVIGGLVNLFFYYASESVKLLFFRQPGDPAEIAEMMNGWERLIFPTVGGLLAGLVLYWGLRLVGQQGSSNLLEVVVAGDGRLPFRTAVVKFFSSLISISSGASIGREGGVTQLSATLASKWGQFAKWPPYRLRLLVGCGAASGIAAAYNAPIAGAVFASLIVLGNFSMNLFAPLVFSSVVAAMVSRSFFGIKPWYTVPPFDFTSVTQLPWFLILGIFAGMLGAAFLVLLRRSEELFKHVKAPIYIRVALGGLLVGIVAQIFPQVWGNGYPATNQMLVDPVQLIRAPFSGEHQLLIVVAGLLVAKLIATLATVGSGAVGGVFTPTLFLGASLGALFGLGLHRLGGGENLPVAAFALVGMGSLLAATTRSPLLSIIMVFEISLDYSLMPPLMLGCVVAILVSSRFVTDSVYTEPLRQKGLMLRKETTDPGAATERIVADIMQAPVPPVRENTRFSEIAGRFLSSSNNFLPVVDGKEQIIGVVALHDLKQYLSGGAELNAIIAYDVMRPPPPCVTPNQRLLDILPVVLSSEQRNIPVVNSLKENRLIGAVVRAEVLNLFSEAIAASSKPEGNT